MLTVQTEKTTHVYDYGNTTNGRPDHRMFKNVENVVLYRFEELPEETQDRIMDTRIEQEIYGPYSNADFAIEEIFNSLHKFEELTGVVFDSGYSDEDLFVRRVNVRYDVEDMCRRIEPDELTGLYIDCDICDAWNAHMQAFTVIARAVEYADYDHYSDVYDMALTTYENIIERIGEDVARIVRNAIEAEKEYYQGYEFWREWLCEEDTLYTIDGEEV